MQASMTSLVSRALNNSEWCDVNVTPQYGRPFFTHARANMQSLAVKSMTADQLIANARSSHSR